MITTHTMARLTRHTTDHTAWCTRDHRCGVNEHRAAPVVTARGTGRAVMTRVRAADREYAEVLIRVPLSRRDDTARTQLATLLRLLGQLLDAVTARPGAVPTREQAAIGRQAA